MKKANAKQQEKKNLVLVGEKTFYGLYKTVMKVCNNKRKAALKQQEANAKDYGKDGELRIIFIKNIRPEVVEMAIGQKELPLVFVAEWLWRMLPPRTINRDKVFDKRHIVKWGEVEFFCPDLYYNDKGVLSRKNKKKVKENK